LPQLAGGRNRAEDRLVPVDHPLGEPKTRPHPHCPNPLPEGRRLTGEEVSNEDIIKGYQVEKDRYLEVTKDERENNADHRDRRVRAAERDRRPAYYFVPNGKVGHDAYAVIRETIRSLDKVALARLVLTNREHVMALEARDKGLMGMLLRYPYEVRDAAEYFDEIQDVKITKEMTISPST
jgi:DNA end-binding protein Ku